METPKISQGRINQLIAQEQQYFKTANGQEWEKGCIEGLKNNDFNGDGQTSAVEMYKSHADVYASVFEGYDDFSAKAQEIALAQGELYAKFAGDDGVLSTAEYNACLQSDENGALLEQYWEMRDIVDQDKKEQELSSNENWLNTSNEGMREKANAECKLQENDKNRDGKTSVDELAQTQAENNFTKYGNYQELLKEAKEIEAWQKDILKKYSADNENVNSVEFFSANNSDDARAVKARYDELDSKLNKLEMQEQKTTAAPQGNQDVGFFKNLFNKISKFFE